MERIRNNIDIFFIRGFPAIFGPPTHTYLNLYIYVLLSVCVCVCGLYLCITYMTGGDAGEYIICCCCSSTVISIVLLNLGERMWLVSGGYTRVIYSIQMRMLIVFLIICGIG